MATEAALSTELTTAEKLRAFTKELDHIARAFDERISTKEAMINRLTYILGDDLHLAKTVYDYVVLGHLSYHGQLRSRLTCLKKGS